MAAATPIPQAARSRAPVFRSLMAVSSASVWITFPSPMVSSYWPPHMPSGPAASARIRPARARASGPRGAESTVWNAAAWRASPARVATHSPNTLWLVGRPRRRSSSSMQGRSS